MLEIFQYDFMIRAFMAGVVIAIIAPAIGIFLVVRRFSLIADTLAHVSLVGIALGLFLKLNPLLTALITAVSTSIAIEKLRATKKLFEESILALFLSGSLAIALIIISLVKGFNANLFSYLFGSITTVTESDLFIIYGFAALSLFTIYLIYKDFFFIAFDEELAKAQGLPVEALNIVLISLAAIVISLSMRIVGILLTGALMIIPVITAMQWTISFKSTLLAAICFSLIAVITGLFLAYFANLASGGTIVMIAILLFSGSWLLKK